MRLSCCPSIQVLVSTYKGEWDQKIEKAQRNLSQGCTGDEIPIFTYSDCLGGRL